MSPFGLIWIITVLLASVSGLNSMAVVLILSTILRGSSPVISFSSFSLLAQDIAVVAILIRYLFARKGKTLRPQRAPLLAMLFTAIALIGGIISLLLFNGYSMHSFWADYSGNLYIIGEDSLKLSLSFFILIARLFLYLLSYCCVYDASINGLLDGKLVFRRTLKTTLCVVLLFGLLQWFDTFSYLDLEWLMRLYFGDRSVASTGYSHHYLALYSVFPEPSYCGPWLAGIGLALLSRGKGLLKHNVVWGLLCVVAAVMTNSGTAAVVLVVGALIICVERVKIDVRSILLFTAGALVVVLLSSDVRDFINMAFGKLDSASGVIRMNYVFQSYKVFLDTFLLGAGFGQTQGMSLIGGLLSQVGLVGTIVFVLYLFYSYQSINKSREGDFCRLLFVLVIIATEISSSGLIYSVDLWFCFYLCASQSGLSPLRTIKRRRDKTNLSDGE